MRGHCIAIAAALAVPLVAVATTARPQAWVKLGGGYYFKVSASYLDTDEEFNYRGKRQETFADDPTRTNSSFRDVSISAYLEYGMTDALTLVASLPFKILTSKATTSLPGEPIREASLTNGGLADLWISIRAPLRQRGLAASLQGGVKLPLGYEKDPDNDGPPLGTGELDGEIHLLLGQSLYPVPAYLGASAGYRVRGGPLHDEILYSAEAGYTAGRFFMKLRFDGLQNVEAPPDLSGNFMMTPGVSTANGVIVGDQDIFKISPTFEYRLDERAALTAEAFHTLAGKNTVAGTTVSIGLVYTR